MRDGTSADTTCARRCRVQRESFLQRRRRFGAARWFRISLTILVSYSLNYVMQGTEINNLQFPTPALSGHEAGGSRTSCTPQRRERKRGRARAVCSAAAAAAGSTGHDGSGNDSLPSPHNQSPILIYVCPRPSVRSSVYSLARSYDFSSM